jgi:hypothetical protein
MLDVYVLAHDLCHHPIKGKQRYRKAIILPLIPSHFSYKNYSKKETMIYAISIAYELCFKLFLTLRRLRKIYEIT